MDHASHQEVFVDHLNEVKRAKERIERLEQAIDAGIVRAPKHLQQLIAALQSLRGVAKIGAATLVTAAVYSVHRATAARWVSKAHAAVLDGVRQALQSRLRVTKKELSSILRLIGSQLDITLDAYLNGARQE
jgi:uncharacterized protein (DUF885 family)